MRAFLGIALGESERAALDVALRRQPAWPGARKIAPRNWHVTLAFLDQVSPDAQKKLEAGLAAEAAAGTLPRTFSLTTGAYGVFPSTAQARVAWLGFREGVEELRDLHRHIAKIVRAAGLVSEHADDYVPHLTLARMDAPVNVARAIAGAPPPAVIIPVTRVVLFSSAPGAAGSEYTEIASWPLT